MTKRVYSLDDEAFGYLKRSLHRTHAATQASCCRHYSRARGLLSRGPARPLSDLPRLERRPHLTVLYRRLTYLTIRRLPSGLPRHSLRLRGFPRTRLCCRQSPADNCMLPYNRLLIGSTSRHKRVRFHCCEMHPPPLSPPFQVESHSYSRRLPALGRISSL